ncbi:hypothetical protein JNUCC83_01405 [Vagococcus sp. JNUCC 83]
MRKEELEEVTKLLDALKGDINYGTIRFMSAIKEGVMSVEKDEVSLNYGKPIVKLKEKTKHKSVFLSDIEYLNTHQQFFTDEENLYVTPNIFNGEGKKVKENVAYLTTLFADLDHCTVDEAMKRLKASPFPKPSYGLFSGHGVHFYWILSYKLPVNKTDKKGYHYEKSWLKVQKYITETLKSDTKVNDISKFLRIPLSTNHKIKLKKGKIIKFPPVKTEVLIDNLDKKYDFKKDFYDKFCKSTVPFDPNKYQTRKKRRNKNTTNVVANYPLLLDEDIKALLSIRKKNDFRWEGLRTYTLLAFKSINKTEEYIRYVNNEVFENPLSEIEIKGVLNQEKKYYGLKRETLYDWLQVSDEELKEMKVLIPKNEVEIRNDIKEKLDKFDSLTKEYMGYLKFNYIHNSKKKTNKQIGKDLGYDETTISRYKKSAFKIQERNRLVKRMLIEYEEFQNLKKGIEESDRVYSKETLKRLQESDTKITKIKSLIEDRNELTSKNKFKVTVLLGKYKELTRMK